MKPIREDLERLCARFESKHEQFARRQAAGENVTNEAVSEGRFITALEADAKTLGDPEILERVAALWKLKDPRFRILAAG